MARVIRVKRHHPGRTSRTPPRSWNVIDYVVVHELAHLIQSNHTARFRGIVRTHAPGMEWARAWLKDNGQLPEETV